MHILEETSGYVFPFDKPRDVQLASVYEIVY